MKEIKLTQNKTAYDVILAAEKYNEMANRLFGRFANLNLIEGEN